MKILAIAMNTAREAIRNRILYSIVFFAVVMVGIAALFGSVSIGDQMKFIKDFSLMAISLFGVIIAIVLGVNLLEQELRRRTIINILSKPVARWEFVIGKFLGLLATLTAIITTMSVGLIAFLAALTGGLDAGLVLAATASLLEVMIVIAVAIFFSSLVVTPALAGMFTAAWFIAGRSAGYLPHFFSDEYAPLTRIVVRTVYWILPHLDRFMIADRVVYNDQIDPSYMIALAAYAVAYSGVLTSLSILLFSRREFV